MKLAKFFINEFTIDRAAPHNLTNVPRKFIRRTEAKHDRSFSMVTGRNIPGFIIRLTRMGILTKARTIWMDVDTCIQQELLPEGAEATEEYAEMLVGKEIAFA